MDAGTSGDTITNAVSNVTLDQVDSDLTADTLSVDIVVANDADLVVTKAVDDAAPAEGDTVEYTITVDNNGPAQATTLSITDLLPLGVTLVDDGGATSPIASQGA